MPKPEPLREPGGIGEGYFNQKSKVLLRRIKVWTLLFILGLVLSGATAIPLQSEMDWLEQIAGINRLVENQNLQRSRAWAIWLTKVRAALRETANSNPFLFYGTDWLAFGHFVIAIAFIGALRDPVRNSWLFTFGMIACVLVVPYALVFGAIRGIPLWWRAIDCSFGFFGIIPLALCRRWASELERWRIDADRNV